MGIALNSVNYAFRSFKDIGPGGTIKKKKNAMEFRKHVVGNEAQVTP